MDFLKSGLKSVLGSPQPGDLPTGAETVCAPKQKKQLYYVTELNKIRKKNFFLPNLG